MKSGIYVIRNTNDGRVYVGQSVYVKRRLSDHKRLLLNGIHGNEYLQQSFFKSPEAFVFEVLEECEVEKLDEREKYWIQYYQSNRRENGYNIESGGSEGQTWNEEARERRSGTGNPMFGKKQSDEVVNSIRMKNRGQNNKLSEEQVRQIKQRLAEGETEQELADLYGVKISTINKIFVCKNWEWICSELNEKLLWLKNNRNAERNNKIIQEYNSGKTVAEICRQYSYSECLVRNALGDVLKEKIRQKSIKQEELKNAVRVDYQNGYSKKEILEKYGISKTTFTRYTSDLYNENKEQIRQKCIELRKSGMQVKDIAEILGIHRTTVTEYTKHLIQVNTESTTINRVCND